MKVLFLNTPLIFSVTPRIFPEISDEISLYLRNEFTDEVLNPEITFDLGDKMQITLDSQPSDFKSQNKYEIKITNLDEVIYRGKLIVLEQGTDVQNYEYKSQSNARFDYK